MTLTRFGEAVVADIIERTAVQSGTRFETGLAAAVAADLVREGPCRPFDIQLVVRAIVDLRLASLRRYRRSGGPVVLPALWLADVCRAAGGGLARRALLAASEAGGVSESDLGTPTRRGRNRGAEALAVLQSRGLLVANTRGRKEVFELAHPALRETIEDFAITDRARATNARRALTRRIATGERLRIPELFAIQRHLRGTLSPSERAVVRRGLGGAAMRVSLGLAIAMLVIAALYADSRRAYSLAFEPTDAGAAARVVVRLGRPRTAFLNFLPSSPKLGSVIADTGFTAGGLGRDTVARIATGRVSGTLDASPAGHVPNWLREVMNGLRPVPRGIAKALLGDPDGVAALKLAFSDPASRGEILSALAVMGRGGAGEDEILAGALADVAPDIRRRGVAVAAAIARRQAGEMSAKDGRAGDPTSGRPGGSTHAATLRAALGDQSADVRAAVLQEAATLPARDAAGIVTLALRDPDPALRRRAEEATETLSAREPAAVVAALADLLQGGDAGARRAALVLFESIAARAPASSAPVLGRVVMNERTPDDARVAALLILRRTGPPAPALKPRAREGDPAGVVAPLALGGAAALRPAGVARRGRGDRAQRDEGPARGARVVRGRLGRGRDDPPRRGRPAAEGDALRSVGGDANRGGARIRLPEARGPRARRQGARRPEPRGRAGRARVSVGAGGRLPGPGRGHPRPRAQDRSARGAPQPDRVAGAHGRRAARGGAAAAGARHQRQRRARPGSRRRTGSARSRKKNAASTVAVSAHRRARRARRRAHGGRRLPGRRRRRRREGRRRASSPSWRSRRRRRCASPPPRRCGAVGPEAALLAMPTLLKLIGDGDPQVRSSAERAFAKGVGKLDGRRYGDAERALEGALVHGDAAQRRLIVSAAAKAGLWGLLRQAARDGDEACGWRRCARPAQPRASGSTSCAAPSTIARRTSAARRCACWRAEPLAARATCCRRSRRCSTARIPSARTAAVAGIGELPDAGEAGIRLLGETLSQRSEALRAAAARALGRLAEREPARVAPHLERAVRDVSYDVRSAALPGLALAWSQRQNARELGRALVGADTDSVRRFVALEALVARAQRQGAPPAERVAARVELDRIAETGPALARLAARIGRSFVDAPPAEMHAFIERLFGG